MAATLFCGLLSGCAALTNPVADGIPVRRLPPELLGEPKEFLENVPLTFLRQPPPDSYRLAPGDVLGVYIEGILGDRTQPLPVHFPEASNLPPALGYPIPIRENGTLPLPLIDPVNLNGMTVQEAERAIIQAYTGKDQPIIRPGRERVIVTLIRPRTTRVLVIRQDSPSPSSAYKAQGRLLPTRFLAGGGGAQSIYGPTSSTGSGTGTIVELPAYENDVLTALAETGGLPGRDAVNAVVIQRGYFKGPIDMRAQMQNFDPSRCNGNSWYGNGKDGQVVRIPLRIRRGQPLPFRKEDIVLQTGDIVSVEARDTEVFYAGGLLPSGEYQLPRDYDLDVVSAMSLIGGPLINGGINSSNLSGAIVASGLGNPSPSLVSVIRRIPGGSQVVIKVDLNRAIRDRRENILVRAGDVLILQETPGEATTRYFTNVFNFSIISEVIKTSRTTGTTTLAVP